MKQHQRVESSLCVLLVLHHRNTRVGDTVPDRRDDMMYFIGYVCLSAVCYRLYHVH